MRVRSSSSGAIGLVIALLLAVSPTARGQQRTTSTKRIPVTKDRPTRPAPAAPAPARVNQDSINAAERARQDSIDAAEQRKKQDDRAQQEQARRDSMMLAEQRRQDSIAAADAARQDSIARAQARAKTSKDGLRVAHRYGNGFYMALAGGSTMPMRMLKTNATNSYDMGWNVTVPFGWDFRRFPLGLRFDIAMDNLQGKANFLDLGGNPTTATNLAIYSASAGLKLNLPLGRTASRFYIMGGGGAHRITGYATSQVGSDSAQTVKNAKTNPGFYAGGGFNFRFGKTALFLESRYINVAAKRPVGFPYDNANYIPVILGIEF